MYKRIILKLSGETLAPDASKPDAPRGVFDAQRRPKMSARTIKRFFEQK